MKVAVIFPQNNNAQIELNRRIAVAHADLATKTIQKLCCSAGQKQHLMDVAISMLANKQKDT